MDWHTLPENQVMDLAEKLDSRGPRYTSYPTVPVWKAPAERDAYLETLRRLGCNCQAIALYVHLPFCRQRCLYCGCNAHITHDEARMNRYMDALEAEIKLVTSEFRFPVKHSQLHLGGGTPTYFPVDRLARMLDLLIEKIAGADQAERSVEVDPRVTTDEHLDLLAERGFTRISAGLQDVNPQVQQAVRREFSYEQMRDFVARARHRGFSSVNIDLIYGLPLQTRRSWRETLDRVAELKPDRLACFGYAHLPSKMKHQRAINEEDLPSSRDRLGMLLDAHRVYNDRGYRSIGLDHFALPQDDLARAQVEGRLWRNFMGYTTTQGLELLGFGCSGISEFSDLFIQNTSRPEAYSEILELGRLPIERGHHLDAEDRITKRIINNLMCNLDITIPEDAIIAGRDVVEVLEAAMERVAVFEEDGLVERTDEGFHVTPLGQLFVRNLAMPFDKYLPKQCDVTFSKTM